jgi:hypothetical protein
MPVFTDYADYSWALLYSIENTCAPAFMNRLLTEGL